MARNAERKAAAAELAQRWTRDQLMAVRHLGPAIIGREMFEAAQSLEEKTVGGVFGPALLATEPEDVPRIAAELAGGSAA